MTGPIDQLSDWWLSHIYARPGNEPFTYAEARDGGLPLISKRLQDPDIAGAQYSDSPSAALSNALRGSPRNGDPDYVRAMTRMMKIMGTDPRYRGRGFAMINTSSPLNSTREGLRDTIHHEGFHDLLSRSGIPNADGGTGHDSTAYDLGSGLVNANDKNAVLNHLSLIYQKGGMPALQEAVRMLHPQLSAKIGLPDPPHDTHAAAQFWKQQWEANNQNAPGSR